MTKKNKEIIVAVSGGLDPIHIGHVRLFQEAKKMGDKLIVILNNDHWLRKKKGFVFMPQKERKEVIEALAAVNKVIMTRHKSNPQDMSVCTELAAIKPDIFANGGDRWSHNVPESKLCRELGIKTVFNVGRGGKVQSSSNLAKKAARQLSGQK